MYISGLTRHTQTHISLLNLLIEFATLKIEGKEQQSATYISIYVCIYVASVLGEKVVESFFESTHFRFRFLDLFVEFVALEKKKKNGRPHTQTYIYLCVYLSTHISISLGEKMIERFLEGAHFANF